ncbi:sugar transferase [Bacillus pseudomycoides]|uniref:Multidrug MFS transporter n=1 Tax=Bacillus pseudomycoides TaxID=64104 RepID=A0A2A8CAT5_9BACI|nr:sugar transferase [Bacillus pseudomycoides]PDY48200.1 multidrug MFS transporter [Bacillus pseudomycoides]PEA84173.1 multidrug MFS transporter [Bacillus pseudomycoides]PED07750.1 multidrug MFS transporter [Bacillus pseudomycoides]PED71022.1 multidrug MFS transporter [Bacillus pseudomycoides]PEI44336.1 multidrug MFS transporter [Bacillus pseudomycoides]
MALMKVSSGTVKKQGLLAAEEVNQKWLYLFLKRLIDIVGALCGLIFLSPIFIIVALLVKWEDLKSPIFFKQIRVGKNEKEFGMYKFRSMVTDAEEKLKDLLQHNEVSGAMFKMKDDPRVTKLGKFIRKTSIDELPQLLNVLKGDMSLVGPRPPLPREVKEYTSYDKQRLLVTPGCTGLWQVTERNGVGFKEMVELDLEYIQKRGIIYDLKIIFKTIQVMIKSNGAS